MSDWIPIDESVLVCEMANKNKAQTRLPMNIWIDENQTYINGHQSKRVKFQLNHSNRADARSFGSMDLDGNLHPDDLDIGELSQSDIKQLRNFVINNQYAPSSTSQTATYGWTTFGRASSRAATRHRLRKLRC